ncbi:MAG: thiamine biosynthesis protein ThiS [Bacteroidetes bacterium GWF2_38_335]|nr:MAG: thiamine biosynthesis protein ThiS [Bacteroidetes bacterium GWF2_38_335]OFY77503.1 MAG: thiamine biosynthesis protein ThiS [Bacteroidetes bacterium RIFOXYA12_FULL_38_20]HBS87201.1 thiamine biosynthesis protein ThiS [Bacteroidales bacterium]
MRFELNNTPEEIDNQKLTVSELLKIKNYTFKLLVIKINGVYVRKEEYETSLIKEGDQVTVLHLVSGG